MTLEYDESERQAILLSLALTALMRPGWDDMLREIARKISSSAAMYDEFKRVNADVVKPTVFREFGAPR